MILHLGASSSELKPLKQQARKKVLKEALGQLGLHKTPEEALLAAIYCLEQSSLVNAGSGSCLT